MALDPTIIELQKQIAAQQYTFKKSIESIQKAMEPIQLIKAQFASQIATLSKPINEFAVNYANSIAPIIDIIKNIDLEGFEEFKNEFGWLEAISIGYGYKLKNILKDEGKEAVWNDLINTLNNENELTEIYKEITTYELIKPREIIIAQIFEHHKNKDYISSIPLLLSQIEGMIWDLGIYKKIVDFQPNSKYKIDINGKLVLDSKGKKIEWQLGELLEYLFSKESKLTTHTNTKVYSKELRHPILHGRNTNYADPQTSTMLMLLLCTIAEKIKDETKLS